MCRHLAYLGPPVALADLILDAPHALVRQSWAPRDMRGGGTINADGFGVGWYAEGETDPVRYRRDCPMWADANLRALAPAISSSAILAAIRSATDGMPVLESAAAPFGEGPWLFSLNGAVAGWPTSVEKLAQGLPVADLLTLDAPTDAALLWALVRDRLRAGAQLARAIADTVVAVAAAAPGSRLNLLLTDGHAIAASTLGHGLSVRSAAGETLLSSEPIDDRPDWWAVPDGHLVLATRSTVEVSSLSIEMEAP
jgi:gamma-glutamyl hercynylcysteine S-oxide hydrolase